MKFKFILAILLVLLFAGVPSLAADVTAVQAIGNNIERVSVSSDGTQGNKASLQATISGDGRYVAFQSSASNLISGNINEHGSILVRDRMSNTTTLVSIAIPSDNGSCQANGGSGLPSISNDGRYVAFLSTASNLVINDTNGGIDDVFVRDLLTDTTTIVSISDNGSQANEWGFDMSASISGGGRYVAFTSVASNLVPDDTNGCNDIFVHDRLGNTTTRVSVASDGSQGNGRSCFPKISYDGRYVVFESYASNLVPNDTNGRPDIFLRDLQTKTTIRVSVASDGTQHNGVDAERPNISGDGHYVVFNSWASNLVPGDTNGHSDVFIRDLLTNTTARVSVASNGTQGNNNSYDSEYGSSPGISGNGRYIVFISEASNLVPNDTNGEPDVFIRDIQMNTTIRINVLSNGTQANDESYFTSISNNGNFACFGSPATNLIPNDTNDFGDVFVAENPLYIPQPDTTWDIQTVDSYGVVGRGCSLDLDKNGNPHISYVDDTNYNLKYAQWNGSSWDIQTVDSSGQIGYYTSIALDQYGNPHISYCDFFGNRDLKYAYWNGSAWTISIVDSEGAAGKWSSIAIDSTDNPHISYVGNNYLKYARWNGSSWVISTVDTEYIIGNHCSIALDSNDYPHISYDNYATLALKYAYWNGSAWTILTVDTEGEGGPENSIAVDKYGNPHISYYDGAEGGNHDLKYAHWNGSAWDIQIVDSIGDIGAYNSLALDSSGNPHISYLDFTNSRLKYASWDGSTWLIETVISDVNTIYIDTSLDLDKCDIPHIAYYEDSVLTKDLKYATKNQSCQDVATSTGTGTATFTTDKGKITDLNAVAEETLPTEGKPTGVTFPHGLFSFNIINITPGSTIIITITFPSPIPVGAQYWKCQNGNWIDCTSLVGDDDGDNVLTLTLTDGGLGDADGLANGTIVDPGGPAIAAPAPSPPSSPHASPSLPRQLNQAQISLQYLDVNPEQAGINQPLTITGNVVNTGDQAGNYNLTLKINGKAEQTRMVSVGPQATQPVKFTVTKSKPGKYTIDIGGQRSSFTVIGENRSSSSASRAGLMAILAISILILATIVILLLNRRTA